MGIFLESCTKKFLSTNLTSSYIEEHYELSCDIFDIYEKQIETGLWSIKTKSIQLDCTRTCLNFLQLITEEA